jgi:hypothetical protein
VWRAAVIALTQIQHPAIRELALQAIQDRTRVRSWAVAMLDRNWQAGDHERALSWFEGESDREARHGMELDLLGLWKHHPAPEGELHLLERLYRRGPCSSCREQVVRRWRALDRLPESVRVECAYDANPDIRALVAEE